jgi:mono/diheme cytochrome c family protein
MKTTPNTLVFVGFLLIPIFLVRAQEKPEADRKDSIGRGKYIVEQVAMCIECHTPRDENGRLLSTKYLEGAPVPVKGPPFPKMKWAIRAPALTGLPGYTREQGVRLLTEGITADGKSPDPPMPRFRLNRSDAEAVVAYLKSLR